MTEPRTLCLDAGQSGARACLASDPDRVVPLPAVVTDDPVLPQLAGLVREALAELGSAEQVAIGSSGLGEAGTAAELSRLLAGSGVRRVLLAHDSVTNYLAALGAQPGVVVAAGTGVVTLALGTSTVARVDGWGYLIGDAGSGYWIGRACLDAVLRAHDGRGPATALTALVVAEFGDLTEIYLTLQGDDRKVQRIAAWAAHVARLAALDAVSCQICRDAGHELAVSALAGLRRVGLGDEPRVAVGLSGKVFGSAVVRDQFCSEVRAVHPDAWFTDSTAGSLTGVARLADLPADSPLAGLVDVAN